MRLTWDARWAGGWVRVQITPLPTINSPRWFFPHIGLPRASQEVWPGQPARRQPPPLAVYLAGYGSVVHGPNLGNFPSADSAWRDGRARAKLIEELVRQRIGCGFLLEYTVLGRAQRQSGYWQIDLCRQLGLSPSSAGLGDDAQARHAAIARHARFVEAGWRCFMGRRASHDLGRTVSVPSISAGDLVACVLDLVEAGCGAPIRSLTKLFIFALSAVLISPDRQTDAARLNYLMGKLLAVSEVLHDRMIAAGRGTVAEIISQLLLMQLETVVGTRALTQAVALALETSDRLFELPPPAIEQAVQRNPLLNPNTRLAMLGALRNKNINDSDDMRLAARNQWGMGR